MAAPHADHASPKMELMRRRQLLGMGSAALFSLQAKGTEPGVSQREVVLGQCGPQTGPLAVTVNDVLAGSQLAFDHAASVGGVHGRKLRLIRLDDEANPTKTAAHFEQLLGTRQVLAMFGCFGSGQISAAADVLKKYDAALVAGFAVGDAARKKAAGHAYFVRATTGREAQVLAQHLATIGITRVGIVHLDTPGGHEGLSLLTDSLKTNHLLPVFSISIGTDGRNLAESATAIVKHAPQVVIMFLAGTLPGQLIHAAYAAGARPLYYGMSMVAAEVAARVAGERVRGLTICQCVPFPWSQADALTIEYRRVAEEAKVPISYYSFEGYLSGLVMLEALRRAGPDPSRTKLHAAIRGMKLRLAGMDIDFTTGSYTGSKFTELVQMTREGRYAR